MKKGLHLFLFVFACQMAMAQLNVIGDNFIYSKGTDIFVKQEINLQAADSKVFLREEAQLMQDDNVQNTGAGFISLFQEGTSNEFTYNYWSAPVSDASTGTNGNVGFKNTQISYPTVDLSLPTPPTSTDLTTTNGNVVMLPVNENNGISDDANIGGSALRIAGRWLYTFDSGGNIISGNAYSGWSRFNSTTDVARTGYGFTMKGVREISGGSLNYNGGQRYDFRGRANNGTIQVGVGDDNGTLAGNPYPSALDLKRFLEVNSPTTGTRRIDPWVEFWESQVETDHNLVSYLGGYARYVPLGFSQTAGVYDNNGTYLEPIFRRTDNDGNIITSSAQLAGGGTATGPPGDQTSFGANDIDGKRRYAAIGQGFFISRTNTTVPLTSSSFYQEATPNLSTGTPSPVVAGDYATFNNSMRVFQRENTTSSIFKSAVNPSGSGSAVTRQIPKMTINVVPGGLYARPLKLIFSNNTTQEYDYAWESPVSGRVPTDAYIKIGANGEYGLSSQAFDENMTIPLGVQVATTFTSPIDVEFEIASMINFDPANVYLHDIETGTYHDIKSGNKTLLIAPGHYKDRFEITFKDTSGTLSNDSFEPTNFDVVQNNRNKELTVLNPDLQDVAIISLYDLSGRQIFSTKPESTKDSYSFDTATLSNAIYIVKITTFSGNEKSVKVNISN
ncbi:T9SS type A sorting domain-containing protein [Nonlabens sp.]|uniref:T9SS type A sorting domain-containing protein n=1 Tax=Nonlabens sp. TaxID=1888209 RepID=UPI003F69BF5F